MRLSLEEMNILSERLEKEEARLHQAFSEDPERREEARQGLAIISMLQRKFEDLEADLTDDEKQLLNRILVDEINHIHGHGTGVYESILSKVNQE
jgi:hypothetical protein